MKRNYRKGGEMSIIGDFLRENRHSYSVRTVLALSKPVILAKYLSNPS